MKKMIALCMMLILVACSEENEEGNNNFITTKGQIKEINKKTQEVLFETRDTYKKYWFHIENDRNFELSHVGSDVEVTFSSTQAFNDSNPSHAEVVSITIFPDDTGYVMSKHDNKIRVSSTYYENAPKDVKLGDKVNI